ncbi:MAG: MFS transporter, partial [Chloroflexi bacterium]|nr:MFS transporter [Chloroflexota bacterium]
LAFIGGLTAAFDNPARQAFVVEMVGREDLPNAVALNSGLFNLARIVGPAVGGLIIGSGTLPRIAWTFYLNSASYVPALFALALMDNKLFRAVPKMSSGKMLAQVAEAWRYCFSLPATTIIIVMMAIIGTFGYNFSVSAPLLATYLHSGARGFGILSACMGAGSLGGAVYLARQRYFTTRLLLLGAGSFAVFMALVSQSHLFLLTCGLLVAAGVASLLCNASGNTLLQMHTPDELRGRVMSIFFLLLAGSTPIGGYLTGVLAQHYRILFTLGLEAGIVCLGVLWAIYYYISRHLGWGDLKAKAQSNRKSKTDRVTTAKRG